MRVINYVRNPVRNSPINQAAFRVLLGLWALWKLFSYEWARLSEWPAPLVAASYNSYLIPFEGFLEYILVEVWLVAVLLVCVTIGYRIATTAFLSSVLLAHLSGMYYTVTNSSSTFLPGVFALLLLAYYSETDTLTVDAVRRTANQSLSELNDFLLHSDTRQEYRFPVLKWSLLILGLIYFFTGFAKVKSGAFEWATAANLGRSLLWESGARINGTTVVTDFLLNNPILLSVAVWLTLVLEVGLLIAILVRLPLTPFAVGLLSMHTMIALTMQIFFFDQYLFFALFLPWDRFYSRLVRSNDVDIIYDGHCYFCARSLYLFKYLDTDSTVTFYTPETAPADYLERPGVDPESAMYAVADGQTYEGYHAFRRLLGQFRIFAPVTALMAIPPVVTVGELVYARIAANRNRYFACDVDTES